MPSHPSAFASGAATALHTDLGPINTFEDVGIKTRAEDVSWLCWYWSVKGVKRKRATPRRIKMQSAADNLHARDSVEVMAVFQRGHYLPADAWTRAFDDEK